MNTYAQPTLSQGYREFEDHQRKQIALHTSQYVYLPLLDFPLQQVDKGFVQAGTIEMIIPFAQITIPGELPAEMTQRVVERPSAMRAEVGATELSHPAAGENAQLRVGEMSTVAGLTRQSVQYFSRPGLLVGYIKSAQTKGGVDRGGTVLQSLANITPEQWLKMKLNEYIFGTTVENAIGQPVAAMIPKIHRIRTERYRAVKAENPNDSLLTALCDELLLAEGKARDYAERWINTRDSERAQGVKVGTSKKDAICLQYLERKWAIESANEVLKTQQQMDAQRQVDQLEMARQNAENTKKLAETMEMMAKVLVQQQAPVVAPPAPPAPVETKKNNQSNK